MKTCIIKVSATPGVMPTITVEDVSSLATAQGSSASAEAPRPSADSWNQSPSGDYGVLHPDGTGQIATAGTFSLVDPSNPMGFANLTAGGVTYSSIPHAPDYTGPRPATLFAPVPMPASP